MRRTTPIRVFSVLVAAGSLAAVPLAGPVSAAAKPPTTCDNPTSKTDIKKGTSTFTLANCSNKPATGGSGVGVVNFKSINPTTGTVNGKITWKGTGTTTFSLKFSAGKPNKCKAPLIETVTVGKVTGGTGKALTLIPKGSPYSETVCANTKTGSSTILKGTKVII